MILNKFQPKNSLFFLLLFGGHFFCNPLFSLQSQCPSESKKTILYKTPGFKDTTYFAMFRNRGVQVKLILPEKPMKGMVLLLPGWNLPDVDWSAKTNVCSKALSLNYGLMFVEMGKSVYMDSFYPSMRKDYKFYPTRTWLWDTVIKPVQQYGWFVPGSNSFVLGLSTGARGALLLGIEHGDCFKAVAGLSGDYNPLLDKNDGLMVNTLGEYAKNAFRWSGTNNIYLRSNELNCHTFLAHGENDQIVPFTQTNEFWKKLQNGKFEKTLLSYKQSILYKAAFGQLKNRKKLWFLSVKQANHDYQFWDYAGQKAVDFFESVLTQ